MTMPMLTIQSLLCASEETRQLFWVWMEKYTFLVNELLEKIPQHSQFQEWQKKGDIPLKTVREILSPLKGAPQYAGLPGRFYTSAELMSCNTYKSWLALQKERQIRLTGKKRWLHAVESEFELSAITEFNPDKIRSKAGSLLKKATQKLEKEGGKQKELIEILLEEHDKTAKNPLSRRAINHLLINDLKISEEEQNLSELSERLEKKKVEIRRLEEQLTSRLPKGRDPTGQRYLQILCHISASPELRDDPEKLEAELDKLTEQQQLPLFNTLPYPIRFDSSGDLHWSLENLKSKHWKHPKERICLDFKGVKGRIFKIQCSRRQLPVFRQFLNDYQAHESLLEEERFSEGLFALRSACLIWHKDEMRHRSKKKKQIDQQEDQLKPWNTHRLYLHCTVDRRLLTAEGTEQVREEKKKKTIEALKGKENLEESHLKQLGLNKNQISSVKRQKTTLNRLENYSPPPRPNAKPSEGQSHIVVGVSFSRYEPVTIAIVDVEKKEVLECQSAKELLNRGEAHYIWRNGKKELLKIDGTERQHPNGGKLYIRKGKQVQWKPYRLVKQLHQRHQHNWRQRAKQQQQNRYRQDNSDSNLGLYVDRIISSEIVELALKRKAGTIVIPQLHGIRESIESDIRAQAERRFPHDKERQKEYLKDYRSSFHRWSYGRLSECIKERAQAESIAVVVQKQPSGGNLEQKAIAMALSSYNVKI